MKILAVCFQLGDAMPTIAANLLGELTPYHEVDLLSDIAPKNPIEGLGKCYTQPFPTKWTKWQKRTIRWFGATPVSNWWSRKAKKIVDRDYDVVLAFLNNVNLTSIVAGKQIAKQLGCKFALYTVDAIPAPGGWIRRKSEFNGKMRIVKRIFSAADLIAASNRHMLEYELSVCNPKKGAKGVVLLTPSPISRHTYPCSDENLFLYTGNLYGMRNPNHLFKAFKRLLKVYPNAEIVIVGRDKQLRGVNEILNEEERKHIVIGEHTNDLEPLFRRAKVLVDIDADLNKDPFLSSKITSYLKVNRVILSETGRITPSREMFAGMQTVVQCDHNEESLYEGMLRAIEVANASPDFSERDELIKEFSVERVGAILNDSLVELCTPKKAH